MDSVAQPTTPTITDEQKVAQMASLMFDRLTGRFTKVKSVTGTVKGNTWIFEVKGPKQFKGDVCIGEVSCEARFPANVNLERVHLALYGFCEGQALKLGVPMRRNKDGAE